MFCKTNPPLIWLLSTGKIVKCRIENLNQTVQKISFKEAKKMSAKRVLFYLLAGILGGCVPVMSLHPLYDEQNIVFDEKLLGLWSSDSNETMEFTQPEKKEKTYQLILTSIDKDSKRPIKGIFDVRLVKIENKLFLDVFPNQSAAGGLEEPNEAKWFYNSFFLMPMHSFVKVDSVEPQLKLRITDDDSMKKFLEKDPNAIKHETVEDNPVLTADTKTLQKFVLKHADSNDVFSKELTLGKSKIQKSNVKIVEPPSAEKKN
jgi:hypothetical protein